MAENTSTLYALQEKPWKVWMSSSPDPTGVLTSGADLILPNGANLNHDIIIYNGNVYSNGVFNSDFNNFYKYYIDIEPAIFDKRYKCASLDIDCSPLRDIGFVVNDLVMHCHTEDGALYPEDIKAQFSVSSSWKNFFHPRSNLADYSITSYQISDMMTLGVKGSENVEDIILSEKDSAFSNTMTFEDGKEAYTKLRLRVDLDSDNECSDRSLLLLAGAIIFNSNRPELLSSLYSAVNTSISTAIVTALRKFIKANETALSSLYFYVKAPFAGDYVKPSDFNQTLNQDSEVSFRNLLLANDYDQVRNNYNRFDGSISSSTGGPTITNFIEKMTRPYVPKNSPLKDMISNDLMISSNVIGSDLETKAKSLIDKSYLSSSLFGSALVTPLADDERTRFTPFSFYDPQSREETAYYVSLGRIPTVIGKDGNITTDGRIMSPTIDELWYVIKKLISGKSDADDKRIAVPDGASYSGDTSLKEAVDAQYNFNSVKADPIDFMYNVSDEGEVTGFKPSEWVAQPDKTKLIIFSTLKEKSKQLNTFYKEQNDSAVDRDLENDDGLSEMSYIGQEFGPREAPLSLRELEAAMLGNKYNIAVSFIYNTKTYSVTGKFGKKDEKSGAAGSLYQLHKDYNAEFANPNTVYKNDGGESTDAVFSDLNGVDESDNGKVVHKLDTKHKKTDAVNGKKMPMLAVNYGKSLSAEYSSSEVYLAADGTWRYVHEHVRAPVLRSRY